MTLTAAQHEERLTGIGASDAAAAMGISPWKTPLDLYLEKTQEAEPDDLSDNELVYWGTKLEDAIAEGWSDRTGIKVARVNLTLRHPEHDFMLAHLDRRQVGQGRVLECKNVNHFHAMREFGEDGTDEVPDHYLVQVHHQIVITQARYGYTGGDLAALVGGNRLRSYRFEYDEDLAELIIARESDFWRRVIDRRPPPPQTIDDLTTLYARDNGEIKDVDASVLEIWKRYWDVKEHADRFARELGEIKDQLRFAVAEAAGIRLENITEGPESAGIQYAGHCLATWKAQDANRVDINMLKKEEPEIAARYTTTNTTRVLRVSKP